MSSDQNLRDLNDLVHYQSHIAQHARQWLIEMRLYGPSTYGFRSHKIKHWEMLRDRQVELGGSWSLLPSNQLMEASDLLKRILRSKFPVDRKTQQFLDFISACEIEELERVYRERGDLVTAAMIKLIGLQDQEDLRALNVITSVPT